MPHKSDSNYQEGVTLSELTLVSPFTRTLFSPNGHFVSLLSVSLWKFISAKPAGQGPFHWPLALVL